MRSKSMKLIDEILLKYGEMSYNDLMSKINKEAEIKYPDLKGQIWFFSIKNLSEIINMKKINNNITFRRDENLVLFKHKYSLLNSYEAKTMIENDVYINAIHNYIELFESGTILDLFKYIEDNKERYLSIIFNKNGDVKTQKFFECINNHLSKTNVINGLKVLIHNNVVYIAKDVVMSDSLHDILSEANDKIFKEFTFLSTPDLLDIYREESEGDLMFNVVNMFGENRSIHSALYKLVDDNTNQLATFKINSNRYYLYSENKPKLKPKSKVEKYLTKNILADEESLKTTFPSLYDIVIKDNPFIEIGDIKYYYLKENEDLAFEIKKDIVYHNISDSHEEKRGIVNPWYLDVGGSRGLAKTTSEKIRDVLPGIMKENPLSSQSELSVLISEKIGDELINKDGSIRMGPIRNVFDRPHLIKYFRPIEIFGENKYYYYDDIPLDNYYNNKYKESVLKAKSNESINNYQFAQKIIPYYLYKYDKPISKNNLANLLLNHINDENANSIIEDLLIDSMFKKGLIIAKVSNKEYFILNKDYISKNFNINPIYSLNNIGIDIDSEELKGITDSQKKESNLISDEKPSISKELKSDAEITKKESEYDIVFSKEISEAFKEFYDYIEKVEIPCNNCEDKTITARDKLLKEVKKQSDKIKIV